MKKYLLATFLFTLSLHIMPVDGNVINLDEINEKTISLIQANIEEAQHCNDEARVQSWKALLEDINSRPTLKPHTLLRITLNVLLKRTVFDFGPIDLEEQELDNEFTQLRIMLVSVILNSAISAYYADNLQEMNQLIMLADSIENKELPEEEIKNLAAQIVALHQLQKEHVAQAAVN